MFNEINQRMQTALYFHREQADLFNFLGLHGFHDLHEYQYWEEAEEARKFKSFVITHSDKIIFDPPPELDEVKIIPDKWLESTRLDVDPESWRKYVKESFELYYKWESGTLELYEMAAAEYLKDGKMADYAFMMELVQGVSEEKAELTDMLIKMQGFDYDLPTIQDMQQDLSDKYKQEEDE